MWGSSYFAVIAAVIALYGHSKDQGTFCLLSEMPYDNHDERLDSLQQPDQVFERGHTCAAQIF